MERTRITNETEALAYMKKLDGHALTDILMRVDFDPLLESKRELKPELEPLKQWCGEFNEQIALLARQTLREMAAKKKTSADQAQS